MAEAFAPLVWLAPAAFIAGLVDSIGGGGGLITVPALLALGLPPHSVLATNKGQACFGAVASLLTYVRRGGVHRERLVPGFIAGFLGSIVGALLVLGVPSGPLRPLVLVLLLMAALVMLARHQLLRFAPRTERPALLVFAISLAIGAYDGFFGPGTGTLLIAAFIHFFGDSPTQASGNAKIVNFGSKLAALLVFQAKAAILWRLALPMGLANICGAALGARLALKHGDRVVRTVVLIVIAAVMLKLAFELKG